MERAEINLITSEVIGAAIDVHRALGPGLLEALYERAMSLEFQDRGLMHSRQLPVPAYYKGVINFNSRLLKDGLTRIVS